MTDNGQQGNLCQSAMMLPFSTVLLMLLLVSNTPARADMYKDCGPGVDPDLQIRACSQVIKRGKKKTLNIGGAHFIRGTAHLLKGQHGRAIADYNKSIAVEPQHFKAHMNRGVSYLLTGEYGRASADFTQSIKLKPNSYIGYANRAWNYFKWGKPELGLPDANRALKLKPDSGDGFEARGHIYEALGQKQKAIADLREAVKLDPSLKKAVAALRRLVAEP